MTTEHLLPSKKRPGLTIPATTVFIVGEVAGTGVLALPKAVENTGWIGILIIIYLSVISAYTGVLLGNAWCIATNLYKDCRGHISKPYPLLAERAYGKVGRYVVDVSTTLALFGSSTVFLLLAGDNMQTMVSYLGKDISFCYWLLIITAFLIPLTWFGTPKDFRFVGIGATLASGIACVFLVVLVAVDSSSTKNPIKHVDIKFQPFALSMGTIMFGLAGHPIFPTLQTDMNRQSHFKWAVISGFAIICSLYVPVAACGYFLYGDRLKANILDTVSAGPFSYTVMVSMTIHLTFAYVIVINPLCQAVESKLNVPKEFTWKRCLVRAVYCMAVLFVAETIPRFDAILSLIGGSVFCILDFICPVLFYIKMCRLQSESKETTKEEKEDTLQIDEPKEQTHFPLWMKVLNYEVVLIGAVVGFFASVSALISIVGPDSFSVPCYINISSAST